MTARSCAHVPLTPSISRFASPGRGCRSRFAANSRPPAAAALSAAHTTDAPSPLYCLAPIARKALMTIWIGCRTPSVGVDAGGRSWRYTAGPSLLTVRSPFLRSRPPRVAVSGIRIRPDGQVSLKPSTEARDERGLRFARKPGRRVSAPRWSDARPIGGVSLFTRARQRGPADERSRTWPVSGTRPKTIFVCPKVVRRGTPSGRCRQH